MSESGGFLKFNFRQTNAITMIFFTQGLCWKYYNKPKNLIVIPSNTIILSSKLKKKKKKKHEKYQNLEGFFQILTHSNYKQTSGIQLEFFTQGLWWEYYSKPKN